MIATLYFSKDFTGVFKHLAVISNKLTLIIELDLKLCLTLLEARFIDEALDLCLINRKLQASLRSGSRHHRNQKPVGCIAIRA